MRAKSAMTRNNRPMNIDYELDHQQQKSKILDEDRKNFLRQAEEIKQKNKEEMEKLKQENKKLKGIRDEFISSKKSRNPNSLSRTAYNAVKTMSNDPMGTTGSLPSNTDENYLRRMLDKEKHETKTKKAALFTLQDKLKEVESNKLRYIEESPLMRNIRVLENRLDKVMIKYNEAQSIQQTYEVVVKRLKEERVGYDSQLAAIEGSLKGKQHDFEELLLLAHDATHAKEAAYGELKRFEQRRITVQEMRQKYLNDKKEEINRDVPEAKNHKESRVMNSRGFSQKESGSHFNPNRGQQSQHNQKATTAFTNSYKHDENYQRQELNDYEEAFRKLKEVTGVIDANEIIQKFKTQGLTTNSLEQLKESYKKKIQSLKEDKDTLKKDLEEKKLLSNPVGSGAGGSVERKRLDQIESQTATLTNQHERVNLKLERLESQLINAKAGIQHIKDLTSFYKKEGETSESVEDDLRNINEKLRRMYDVVKNDPGYSKRGYQSAGNANAIRDILVGGTNGQNSEDLLRNYNDYDANDDDDASSIDEGEGVQQEGHRGLQD